MAVNDDLADYKSEEDEDYVPDDVQDGGHWGGRAAGDARSAGSVGTKRKALASAIEQPTRVPMAKGGTKKRKGQRRVGAAVLSEDDDDLFAPTTAPQPQPLPLPAPSPLTPDPALVLTQSSDNGHQTPAADSGTAEEAGGAAAVSTADGAALSADSSSGAALPRIHAVPAAQLGQAATSSQPSSSPAAAAPSAKKGGDDLASLLAQFNKKSSRQPVVKKIINQWELPAKPKQPQAAPAATTTAAAAPAQQTAAASSDAPPAVSSEPTSAPAPTSSSSGDRVLSNEQLQVTEYTSFAGQALQSAGTHAQPLQTHPPHSAVLHPT